MINQNIRKLWFVNLCGYNSLQLAEIHKFDLIVSTSYNSAKSKAKMRFLKDIIIPHNDDTKSINNLVIVDSCLPINKIAKWNIVLTKDPENRREELIPDWYG